MTDPTPQTTATRVEAVLLPCPFCGSPGKMISCMGAWAPGGYEPDGRRITCSDVRCSGVGKPFYGADMEAYAIAWWNRRASAPAPDSGRVDAVLDAAVEAYREKACWAIVPANHRDALRAALVASLSPAATHAPAVDPNVERLLTAAKAAKRYLEPDLVEPGRTVFWNLVSAINAMEGKP